MILAYDRSLRRFDADGRMFVERCNIAKACVSPYYGREIPNFQALGLDPNKIYKLYRDPKELEASAKSFAGLPLLEMHVRVSAEEPARDVVAGSVGTEVGFDGTYLSAPLSIWTNDAITGVETREQEQLSPSYRYRADMTPGVAHDGELYDGVMRDIIGNHVALVRAGRQGPDVVVSDEKPPLEFKNMRFTKTLALLAALIPGMSQEQTVALDKALEDDLKPRANDGLTDAECAEAERVAKDAKGSDLTDAEKEAAYKVAKDAKIAAANAATGRTPEGGAPNPAGGANDSAITPAELAAAVKLAEDTAVQRVNALHEARRVVEPLVGVVALDSADEVYKFALEKAGVDIKGVHASAYPSLFALAMKQRATPSGGANDSVPAVEAAESAVKAFPGLSRIRAAG